MFRFCNVITLVLSVMLGSAAYADDKVSVVASFSILGDIVQEIGGDISVESQVGQGTEFTIRLPLKLKNVRKPNHASPVGG